MSQQYNFYNLEASFKQYLLAGNKKAVSIKNYLSDYRHFAGWTTSIAWKSLTMTSTDLNEIITEQLIEEYKNYMQTNNIPLKTINRRLSTIRKFCSFCISQGWMKENPAKKISNIVSSMQYSISGIETQLKEFESDLLINDKNKPGNDSTLADIKEFFTIINS